VHWIEGADDNAKAIAMNPVLSGRRADDEGLYVIHHQHWVEEMLRAIDRERRASALFCPTALCPRGDRLMTHSST
jgi:hypothetical protein